VLSYLLSMELTDVSIDAIVALAKTKTNKMVFSTDDLVLIKVLRQEKGTMMSNHAVSLEITVNMRESVLSMETGFG